MKLLKYLIVLISVIISFVGAQNNLDNCAYGKWDYSYLYNSTGYATTDYEGNAYYFNICGVTPICNPLDSNGTVTACTVINGTPYPISLGMIDLGSFNTSPNYVPYVSYVTNSTCNGKPSSFRINFKPTVTNSIYSSKVVENTPCSYQVNFYFPYSIFKN